MVGSAQRRFKGGFIQHGSILLGLDSELWERVFSKKAESFESRLATVGEFTDITTDEFKALLTKNFSESIGVAFDKTPLTDDEQSVAEELVKVKYDTDAWNKEGKTPLSVAAA